MSDHQPSEDEIDAKAVSVRQWLRDAYGYTNQQLNEGEVSVAYDGEEHWVFDVWAGEAEKSERDGTGYIHPSGQIEGLY